MAAVIRHVAFEDLGTFEAVLHEQGWATQTFDAGVDNLFSPITSADLVIVLGGPIGVNEQNEYPFLKSEREALSIRLKAQRPTLGVCLGAQLIASALGARVYSGQKEIGWGPVSLTSNGENSCLQHLQSAPVLHWHGDVCELPDGAELLATTPACPNQAFALGANILALQFHGEVKPERIEQWLIGHSVELASTNRSPSELRHQTSLLPKLSSIIGASVLSHWLSGLQT